MTGSERNVSPLPRDGEVWYVSYGSNMSESRLACYIQGGTPPGATRHNPGARDPRPPRHSIGVKLPGSVYFAGESSQWGGGVAFYDHETPGPSVGRAYLVTAQQFADIAAQEMHRVPDPDDPIEEIVLGGLDPELDGRHHVGPGHYETLIEIGRIGGAPMLTFTAPHGIDHVTLNEPSPAYLAMLAQGLREGHDWDDDKIGRYFDRLTMATQPQVLPIPR
ncbi:MAG TPA: histone deacetylase [Nocardioidaceae bacterium]|nr:histone deacetylase [Nocardioidaceae bacterium]